MNEEGNLYCTYLTVYRGNKLPPFYIGYTRRVHTQEMRDRYKKHYMIEYYDGTREKIFGKVEFLKKLGIDRNRFERCMKKQQPVCGIVSCIEIKEIYNAII